MCLIYALHMRCQSLVLLSCLYTEPSELVIEIIFHTAPRLPATNLICSNVHSGAAALSASMMLLCRSLASSSFTTRKPSFLSDAFLIFRMYSVRWFRILWLTSCLSLYHPASNSKNDFHKTLLGRNHGVPFRALSQGPFFQFLLPFPSAILCCISAQTLPHAATTWRHLPLPSENPYFCQMTVWTLGCIVFYDTFNHYAIWPTLRKSLFLSDDRLNSRM